MPFLFQNTVSSEETDNFKQEVRSHLGSEAHHTLERQKKPLFVLMTLPGFNSDNIPPANFPVKFQSRTCSERKHVLLNVRNTRFL